MDLFSPKHLLIIFAIILLVFGTKKLRTIGSDLGHAFKGFKDSMKEGEREDLPPAPPLEARQITGQEKVAEKVAEKPVPVAEKEKTSA